MLLGHGLWERRFNSDPAIVGTSLTLNDEPHTVVGVLPASFDFASVFAPGSHFDLYFPFPLSPETNRWGNTMAMIGRLKPGVSADRAQAEIRTLAAQITAEHPERNGFQGNVKPLADQVERPHAAGGVGARRRGRDGDAHRLRQPVEPAPRARRRRGRRRSRSGPRSAPGGAGSLAQMLTEGIVLSCSGALLGLVLAFAGTRALARLDAVSIPLLRDVRTRCARRSASRWPSRS